MATSDGEARGSFFFSRRNMVGMALAVAVIVLQLVVGLGALWPVVALAAWGAGALLTPPERGGARPAPGAARPEPLVSPRSGAPGDLRRFLDGDVRRWERGNLSPAVADALARVHSRLCEALDAWDLPAGDSGHRMVVRSIITEDLPAVMDGHLAVPRGERFRTESDVASLLGLLAAHAGQAVTGPPKEPRPAHAPHDSFDPVANLPPASPGDNPWEQSRLRESGPQWGEGDDAWPGPVR